MVVDIQAGTSCAALAMCVSKNVPAPVTSFVQHLHWYALCVSSAKGSSRSCVGVIPGGSYLLLLYFAQITFKTIAQKSSAYNQKTCLSSHRSIHAPSCRPCQFFQRIDVVLNLFRQRCGKGVQLPISRHAWVLVQARLFKNCCQHFVCGPDRRFELALPFSRPIPHDEF